MSLAQSLLVQAADYVRSNVATLSDTVRAQLRNIAFDIGRTLETPQQTVLDFYGDTYRLVALAVASDSGMLQAIADSPIPLTTQQIGQKTSVEPEFVHRFLRLLSAYKMIDETGPETFAANEKTRFLMEHHAQAFLRVTFRYFSGVGVKGPDYFKKIGYKLPKDVNDTLLADVYGQSLWATLAKDQGGRQAFNDLMVGEAATRADWTKVYPCKERLVRTSPAPEVLLVDIGGGVGHDLRAFKSRGYDLPGKLVLEDQESTFEKMTEAQRSEVNATVYDFFTPQPVIGAGNYFMHHIMHDWTDEEALAILKNQVPAMNKDSRFLINDFCVPEQGATKIPVVQDLMMMFNVAGKERTRKQWDALLSKAGMKITEVYFTSDLGESLIECELASNP